MTISWWRSWHNAPTDHKWAVIASRANVKTGIVSAIAWALFDYASQHVDRGSIKDFDVETYAVYSGFDDQEINAVIKAMCDKGIITNDSKLSNWDKRQPKREDYSTERVSRFRTMKRNETQCNAPDKDKDKDKDKEEEEEDKEVLRESRVTEKKSRMTEEKHAAATADFISLSEFENSNQYDLEEAIETQTFIKIWSNITGNMGLPVKKENQTAIINSIAEIYYRYKEKTQEYLKPYFDEWIKRKYSRTNPGWLDWALAGEITPAKNNNGSSPKARKVYE